MYDHGNIDGKWQKKWEDAGIFHAKLDDAREKYYLLVEFPYPSGAGLHVGHPRSYTALDVIARKRRMEGKNVLYPIGWDAFGLPAENHAIKTGTHPAINTAENIKTFKKQIQSLGISFDWSREIDTTDPKYYRWTQWMFNEFFRQGLCYKAKMPINWCPSCKIGLANEEAAGGVCERCGGPVEKKEKEQWMIAMTKYADRLLEDLKTVDYLPKIKKEQEEWIGRSEGAEIDFRLEEISETITVFTTRPDTIFGVTYIVLAPEHPLVARLVTDDQRSHVEVYISSVASKTDDERGDATREKTGVFTGAYAVNPVNGERVPVWIADYVLGGYGTGAVMAVPAHDVRDFAFATTYELPIRPVVAKYFMESENPPREGFPTVRRKNVHAIVRRATDGAVLMLRWKANQRASGAYPHTFIVGGIEEGEDAREAVLREIAEETGLHRVRFVSEVPAIVHSEYFAGHKEQNRYAEISILCFEADGDEAFDVAPEELEKHDPIWVLPSDVASTVNVAEGPYIWAQAEKPFAMTDAGYVTNSDFLNGLSTEDAKKRIVEVLAERGWGRAKTTYRLRDWVFSRQRYWGEPIPLIQCKNGCSPETNGWVTVPDEALPVTLPNVERYEPTDTGESPLSVISDWVNTTCPQCGGDAVRETDTMPNWAGSSWYFLRYADAHNDAAFASKDALAYWLPVDLYNGGMEHATRHLLYARFWTKVLFDRGHLPFSEFCQRRVAHGMILAEDGTKMSKSKGNVVNPDDVVKEHGADTLRVYELFIGAFDEVASWSTNSLIGVRRFLDRITRLQEKVGGEDTVEIQRVLQKTLQKVTDDIEGMRFNTAVAALMACLNELQSAPSLSQDAFKLYLRMLVPFAPHVANECWENIGGEGFVEAQAWPVVNASLLVDEEVTYAVQVNGKVRATLVLPADAPDDMIIAAAKADEYVAKYLGGQEPKKVIIIPKKIVSFVV
jgi:leucyl-tRNA synthetase